MPSFAHSNLVASSSLPVAIRRRARRRLLVGWFATWTSTACSSPLVAAPVADSWRPVLPLRLPLTPRRRSLPRSSLSLGGVFCDCGSPCLLVATCPHFRCRVLMLCFATSDSLACSSPPLAEVLAKTHKFFFWCCLHHRYIYYYLISDLFRVLMKRIHVLFATFG